MTKVEAYERVTQALTVWALMFPKPTGSVRETQEMLHQIRTHLGITNAEIERWAKQAKEQQ